MSSSPPSIARQLLDLISASLTALEKSCEARGTPIPDLNAGFHPASEAFRVGDPAAAEAANVITAAALHLAAIVAPPQNTLYQAAGGFIKSTALRACLESNVTEILREAGPEGLHINDIGAKNAQDPQKIGRFLRVLATHHIYREVKPNVFANTRVSSMLDTLKPSQEVIANPEQKHENTFGLAALASHHLDEMFKASAYAWETLADPLTAASGEPDEAPLARAFGVKETLWQFYARPEQAFRQRRFNIGMQGVRALEGVDASLGAFDWKDLPEGSIIVDVGGGVGTSALPIAREFPKLKLVVQDLPHVIEDAKKVWAEKMPDALKSGQVKLEVQDFFTPQPCTLTPSIFFLKQILHDWSDTYCLKILSHLRAAASSGTRLVLMESLVPFACRDGGEGGEEGEGEEEQGDKEGKGKGAKGGKEGKEEIPGVKPKEAPEPLLANYGAVNDIAYTADIGMFLMFNSQERTASHMRDLLEKAGWAMMAVRRSGDGSFLQAIEARPI